MPRVTNARRSRVLVTSFSASLGLIVVLAVALFLCGTSAEAANNCTLTSTAPTTFWSDTTKWSSCGGTYPNNGDTANIGLNGFTMKVDVPVNVVLQITGGPAVDVSNTLQLEASSTASSFSSITINSGGKLTVAPAASVSMPASTTINSGGILEMQTGSQFSIGPGANFVFAGGTIQGPGTLNVPSFTPIAFTGATGSMTMTNGLILNNSGTVNLVSSTNALAINNGTQFNNQSGATFSVQTSVPITTDSVAAPAINNSGSLNCGSSVNPTINVPVNNTGTIALLSTSSQTLTLAGGGTHTGAFNTAGPPLATIAFNGSHNFNSGWSWNPGTSSTFELLGGTSTLNTGFTAQTFIQDAGTLSGPGNLTTTISFDWKGGTQTGGGSTILSSGSGLLDGTSTATLNGRTLSVPSGATLSYNPGAGGSLAFTNSGVMSLGGTFNLKSDTTITSDGTGVINLAGSGALTKSVGTRTLIQPFVTLPTTGSIQPSGNTIALGGGATLAGILNTSTASSFLEFAGNTATLVSGTTINSGDFLLTGGTLAVNTPLTIATMSESGGTLKGSSTLTVGNTFNWTGGTMDGDTGGTGTLAIATPNGIANINGLGPTTIQHRFTFANGGTVHYQPLNPLAVNTGGQITNSGTWNLENGTAITSDLSSYLATTPLFTNSGTLQKTIAGTTSFGLTLSSTGPLTFNSGADVELTGGGTLNGCTITFNNGGDVLGIQTNNVTIPVTPNITGPGKLRIGSLGTLTNNAITAVPNFELDNNGTLTGASAFNITSKMTWSGGLMTGGGTTTLGGGTTGDMTFLSGSPALNNRTFQNLGTITLTNAFPLQFQGSATFTNFPSGILDVTGAGGTSSSGAGNSFLNQGTVKRSTASGVFSFDLPFTNAGTVDAAFANAFFDFPGGGSMTAGNMSGSVASAGIEFSTNTFSVNGTGNLSGVGGLKINGGTLNIGTAVTAPSSVALLGGTLGTTGGTMTLNSPTVFNMTGGTISNLQLVVNSGASLNFDSTTTSLNVDGANIGFNSGNGQWTGANQLVMKNGANISDGGTFTITGNGNIATVGATPTISVNGGGMLQKTTSASAVGIAANLQNNGGTIASTNGALQLNYSGSSSHTGTFSTTTPGTIDFGGGTHTFTSVTGSGTGFLNFTAGTITLANATTLTNLYLGTATIGGAGPLTFTGTFNWDGGALNAPATNSGGTLNLLGGSSAMSLGANLSSGANFSSPSNALSISSGFTFTNTGTFDCTSNASITGLGTFINSGTFSRSAGSSTTISTTFNNNGTVAVNAGSLSISGGGTDTGSYTSVPSGAVNFNGGTRTMTATSVIGSGLLGTVHFAGGTTTMSGAFGPAGTTSITGGSLTLNTVGTASPAILSMTGGTLSGSSPAQVTGSAFWSGGTITGAGSFTVPGGVVMIVQPTAATILDARTITNAGTINLLTGATQALEMDNGASIANQGSGSFSMQNDQGITTASGASTFSNAGVLQKAAGAGIEGFSPALTNTGTFQVLTGTLLLSAPFAQSSGITGLIGGAISAPSGMSFSGGLLNGAGTINGNVANSGATIDPGNASTPGAITVNGTFNQTAGTLVTDLFANNSNDQLLVPANTANVAGNLTVQLVSPYSPANGDSFTLINAGTLTDTTTKTYPAFGPNNTGFFTPTDTATTLSLVAAIPQADLDVSGTTAPGTVVHTTTWTVNIPVVNNGPSAATGVTVTVNATGGTLNSLTSTLGSCVGNVCTIGPLGVGGSAIVSAGIIATTMPTVSATATVAANESDPASANNTKSVSATVTPSADLGLTITDSPDPVNAGSTVNYTVTVTNGGPDSSGSVTTLTLSGGTFGTLPAGCGGATPTITCTSGTLGSGGSATFIVPVTAPGAGPISLSGSVAASGATDLNGANNNASQSTAVTPKADLQITKSGPASVAAGSNITYTIVVTNNGPSDAASVQVSDLTPAGLTFAGNSGACSTTFPCSLGTLTSGASATISSTFSTAPAAGPSSVTNTASVSSPTGDPVLTNNSASATTSIGPSADVAITVSAPSTALPGSNFNITVKIQNNGPSTATGISVTSSVSPALTFVSNSGACSTPYPCSIGTLNPGQFVQIVSTYNVAGGGTTALASYTASASTADPNSGNNSATATITTGCPSSAPTQLLPGNQSNVPAYGFLSWDDVGAAQYNVYLGQPGSGCTTFFGSRGTTLSRSTEMLYSLQPGTTYEWAVEAVTPNCPTHKSACVTFTIATNCNAAAPQPVSPVNSTVASPVTFTWTASSGATLYTVKNAADDSVLGTSTTTSLGNVIIPDGPFTWYVVADVPQCGQLRSVNVTFNGCSVPAAPIVGAVAQATSGQTYALQWDRIFGVASYDVEEATTGAFTDVTLFTINQPANGNLSVPFTKSTTQGALVFFYRVRARSLCNQSFGPYSEPIRVVVLPPPPKTQKNPSVSVPVGSTLVVVQQVFVPGLNDGIVHTFTATVDQPWLTVDPSSGILPADGITLNVNANPANLPNGTETGTVIVTIFSGAGKTGSNGTTVVTTPVSVNLVTPVIPSSKDLPPDNTLIIPSVGHLDGANSHWQSDIRLANTGAAKLSYALKFTPADPSDGGVKTTTINVDGGATTALDDIVRNWYGIGTLGESANGVLEVRPLTPSNKGIADADAPSVSKVTVVSSRTYTTSDNGTLGQFIPAIPFSSFIGKAAQQAAASVLSLQQIAQSSQYRTNVGIVEGSGQPASVLVSVFDVTGKKLKDVPLSLKGGQQMQIGSFLAAVGIPSLSDGRIEVKVTSGDGRVTAYASVVDNQSLDPLLVTGVKLGAASADNYVLPGVADINTGFANWRTDMRISNGGTAAQNATLTFFRQGDTPLTQSVVINAGEIRSLDSVVNSLFGVTNSGGAVHVTTNGNSNLIVSGRTYNATSNGTFGQFIPAVTNADSIASGDRPLQILQAEDSVRYRTNLGLAEVTGKPAGVDISVSLPDSKVTPVVHLDLAANDFQQFDVFKSLGLDNTYNARISVRVTNGDGRVTAYGSVVDMLTNDPTYVPAQQ